MPRAPWGILVKDPDSPLTASRNRLHGEITRINQGSISAFRPFRACLKPQGGGIWQSQVYIAPHREALLPRREPFSVICFNPCAAALRTVRASLAVLSRSCECAVFRLS